MDVVKKIIVLAFSFQFLGLGAQNLVPNPSFENYTVCPTGPSQIANAISWYGTNTQSDYYNTCAVGNQNVPNAAYGYQLPRTGNAFAGQYFLNGFGTNYREYIQVGFTNTLVTGNCYLVKFHVNCVNKIINFACNNIAAYISFSSFTTSGGPATSYTPQIYLTNNPIIKDSLNWVEIAGIYTASGGENYLTIGNFKNDINTDTLRTGYGTINNVAYYHIDDVSVQQITSPQWKLKDTIILGGDSVLIGPLYSGLICNWFNMAGTPIGSGAGFWVKPNTTTSYVLQQTFCNNTFSDTVTVYVSGVGIKDHKIETVIEVFPNPASNTLFILCKQDELNNSKIELINVLGEKLLSSNYKNEIDVSQLSNGYYTIKIIKSNGHLFCAKFIKQ